MILDTMLLHMNNTVFWHVTLYSIAVLTDVSEERAVFIFRVEKWVLELVWLCIDYPTHSGLVSDNEIWSSHSGEYEEYCSLRSDACSIIDVYWRFGGTLLISFTLSYAIPVRIFISYLF
jgi:hypothetical protein